MALSNLDRVNKGMELLHNGLHPYINDRLKQHLGEAHWQQAAIDSFPTGHYSRTQTSEQWDLQALLHLMNKHWRGGFDQLLGHAERAQVSELMEYRKRTAHQNKTNAFDTEDAYRVLDNVERLLRAIGAPQTDEAATHKSELLRIRYEENTRKKAKTIQTQLMETNTGGLPTWRQIIEPHPDVANGKYQLAEFAADLWQVYKKEATDEYGKPIDFFTRTHLTGGLKKLLTNALQRLNGNGGNPVINLQTNFGGGKTHALLALYHLTSGADFSSVRDLEAFFSEQDGLRPPVHVAKAVLVGEKITPNVARTMDDGIVVHTLWGELAWQLGGKKGYEIVREADEKAVNPGDLLTKLFRQCGPCLVLIDEWVAYLRQLSDNEGQSSGSYGTHMSFAQALCEAAKSVPNAMVVVSIPASKIEMHGERGERAAEALAHLVGRIESPWSVASAEEAFEIVTRRLFSPILSNEKKEQRDIVARTMADFYRAQKGDFPAETGTSEYQKRIRDYYPIHPELFDALANRWASIENFQRTRGILRLMAEIIHALWASGAKDTLILPAHVPMDNGQVEREIMRYLSPNWQAVIHMDVDGTNSLPVQIDKGTPRFGELAATRRMARTLFFNSAPTADAAQRGIDESRLKLGSIFPGENISAFTDALRSLVNRGTFVYAQNNHYWYSTQNNVNRTAEERAIHVTEQEIIDTIRGEVEKLTAASRNIRVHPFPQTSAEVSDDNELKLVVLGISDSVSGKDQNSAAYTKAKEILATKGNGTRMYRNTLLFLAPDKGKLESLQEIARKHLAWKSIKKDAAFLDLGRNQTDQVERSISGTFDTLKAQLPEVYIWLLTPEQQPGGGSDIKWDEAKLSGGAQDGLAERAIKKLINLDLLKDQYGSSLLRQDMDKNKLWRDRSYIGLRELRDDFTKYLYMPKLRDHSVLRSSVEDGINLLSWRSDTFAYADSWNEEKGRFLGLRAGQTTRVSLDSDGILVKPEIAHQQLEKEGEEREATTYKNGGGSNNSGSEGSIWNNSGGSSVTGYNGGDKNTDTNAQESDKHLVRKRFHGNVDLNAQRFFRDAESIEKEILKHLLAADCANIKVTLHIEAETDAGFNTETIRVIKENGRTLNFNNTEFE